MTARLSLAEKQTRGTARPDRAPKMTALRRFDKPPRAPKHLSERARAEWIVLARVTCEIGTLTGADLRSLELLCEVLATEAELRELLKAEGLTIAGAGGNLKGHPATRLLAAARNQAAKMLSDFGLTPKGRQGVDILPPADRNRFGVNGRRDPADKYHRRKPWDR
ncbi:MAG: phage terminase small subunit P27 family [Pseudomonadota bacterium]|nr:phage terminase small subunit P27 family [Pseudomonadota bacterium]